MTLNMKWVCVGLGALLLNACAPRTESGDSSVAQSSVPGKQQERPTLTLAIPREPTIFNWELTTASEISNGLTLIKQIPRNQLMVLDDRGAWVPQMAAEEVS